MSCSTFGVIVDFGHKTLSIVTSKKEVGAVLAIMSDGEVVIVAVY